MRGNGAHYCNYLFPECQSVFYKERPGGRVAAIQHQDATDEAIALRHALQLTENFSCW